MCASSFLETPSGLKSMSRFVQGEGMEKMVGICCSLNREFSEGEIAVAALSCLGLFFFGRGSLFDQFEDLQKLYFVCLFACFSFFF